MGLKQYMNIIRKRLWLIALCVLACTAATALISFYYVKPVYEASTKLIVNKSNDSVAVQPQITYDNVNATIKLIDTYKEIIKTPAIMNKVVEQYPDLGLSAAQLIEQVKVSSVNNTQVMTLEVEDPSYEKAAAIANAVSTVFQAEIPNIMKVDNVAILNVADTAEAPAPIKPNKALNIAVSLILSLILSFGLVILLEYLDDTIKTEEDALRHLGLPALAVISKIKESDLKEKSPASSKRKVGETTYATANH
ncbi:Wzz/FepE/Etk N-terminal domain-containing protein [Paenibacillus aurantius]|uniref:Wzz/FepE/Etk N-terminal domain-containing protein n=1 Tax=Paenibacillus aurantius TaxID=2918900 RepID=A0AA96LCV4_9BACL|nr:Wzz/FepE/Etk N-terminal domain-containing protein [Paenibacillus aurantius]WJH35576.1 Wzz/FepE/Etk N-terminal domain-containing protein [Paenibacillus sp. CC-CFT747]WNQ10834.1 Wzz/FepE/Etk N-terminal domain-containing protein [Paenibacillus aurantius]